MKLSAITSPAWWFSAAVVAIVGNVIANYIYDYLKIAMAGRWFVTITLVLMFSINALLTVSMLVVPTANRHVLAAAVGIVTLFSVWEAYKKPVVAFSFIISFMCVCPLIILEPEFRRAWVQADWVWLGRAYASYAIVAAAVSTVLSGFVFMRLRKRRSG